MCDAAVKLQHIFHALNAPSSASLKEATGTKFDPFLEQSKRIEKYLSDCDQLREVFDSSFSSNVASTSSGNEECEKDPRIQFGFLILRLLDSMTECLLGLKETVEDEYTLVSLKNLSILKKTMDFLVLAGIAPYLSAGIGVPLKRRSQFVVAWKLSTEDVQAQRSQLLDVCSTLFKLFASNEAIRVDICSKYLMDIICANEQLLELGDKSLESEYHSLLSTVNSVELVRELTILSKCRDPTTPPPQWFQNSIGCRLSTLLVSPNGLSALLTAFVETGGESVWHNAHFLNQMAKQLSTVPRSHKKMQYYECITNQFVEMMQNKQFGTGLHRLFSLFVDQLTTKDQFATSVLILDKLFKCWETLPLTTSSIDWNNHFDLSLLLLTIFNDPKVVPKVVGSSERYGQIIAIILQLLSSPVLNVTPLCVKLQKLKEDLLEVVDSVVGNIENQSTFLVSFMSQPLTEYFVLEETKKTSSLIEVIGDCPSSVYGSLRIVKQKGNNEETLGKLIESVVVYITHLPSSSRCSILLECISLSINQWILAGKEEVDEQETRFVYLNDGRLEPEWRQLSSHLIVGVLFEQLGEWDLDVCDIRVALSLANIVQTILRSVRERIETEDNSPIDIRKENEMENRMMEISSQNAKLAIGMAGGLLMAASLHSELSPILTSICLEAHRFSDVVGRSQHSNEELRKVAREAGSLSEILQGRDASTSGDTREDREKKKEKMEYRISRDPLSLLQVDLCDEVEAVRGQSLLRLSRMIRKDYRSMREEVDKWIYEKVIELLQDPDSYVYLNAINALAEIAYADTNYLRKMVDLQKEWREKDRKEREKEKEESMQKEEQKNENEQTEKGSKRDESTLIMRGRLSEATGKVFRLLGDLAPSFLCELIDVYLFDLNEKEEIVRAGGLSAIADMIYACRGRGVERYLDELFLCISNLLLTDPSPLVRRSAVHLVRECIRSVGKNLFEIVGDRLLSLRRSITHLYKWDKDHVVRLHADLCLQELRDGIESAMERETETVRRIRI